MLSSNVTGKERYSDLAHKLRLAEVQPTKLKVLTV